MIIRKAPAVILLKSLGISADIIKARPIVTITWYDLEGLPRLSMNDLPRCILKPDYSSMTSLIQSAIMFTGSCAMGTSLVVYSWGRPVLAR